MNKKLNNLIEFKEYVKLDKLENKPGKKVVEGLNNIKSFDELDENFFTDTKLGNNIRKGVGFKNSDEKFAEAVDLIMNHPIKRQVYEELKDEDPDKARKYVEFFIKNPRGYPKWTGDNWQDTARYSHELGADIGAPTSGY